MLTPERLRRRVRSYEFLFFVLVRGFGELVASVAEAAFEFGGTEAELGADAGGLFQMLAEFLLADLRAEVGVFGYVGAAAVVRDDDAFALQFEVGALYGDDAYFQIHCELADGGNGLALSPVAERYFLFDLFHDLDVHRPLVGLRDEEDAAHVYILSIHR